MSGINFSGLASGLDTDLLVESLLTNRQRRVDQINASIDSGADRKKALSEIKSQISAFDDLLAGIGEDIFGNREVSSSDDGVITAEAEADSAIGDYEITVNNLAQRSVVTIGQAQSSATAQVGAGTLDLNFAGGDPLSVTLSDPNATLTDLATEINDQHGDSVQASIVEVSSGSFQLVLSAKESGADLNILDESDGAGSSTISGFDAGFLDAGATNSGGITRTQEGEDASITLDGITITRSSNEIDDVLDGITLNLRGESTDGPTNLQVDTNFEKVKEGLQKFTDEYNNLLNDINTLTNAETGALAFDSDLRSLKSTLQNQITRFVSNIDTLNVRDDGTSGFTSLSQIGFDTDTKTGELSIDTEELDEALEDNFEEVRNLFLGGSVSSNPNVSITNALKTSFSGTIALDFDLLQATVDGTTYDLVDNNGVLGFEDDTPLEGLFIDPGGATGTATIDLVAGISASLQDQTDRFISFSGIIDDRTQRIDDRSRNLERDLDTARDRLEAERVRLTAVFAKAEQAISTLQGLSASLGAQSGSLLG